VKELNAVPVLEINRKRQDIANRVGYSVAVAGKMA
jgi:hypothetical protein